MQKSSPTKKVFKKQEQTHPGLEHKMVPQPVFDDDTPGSGGLLDYRATKGAIVSFTRSLSSSLVKKGIRVNGVAPGPVWTPLIPASFPADKVQAFGTDSPMGRPAQPVEIAPAYVFLGSRDSSYMTGQIIHVNGGEIING